jgi:hypothetical protein
MLNIHKRFTLSTQCIYGFRTILRNSINKLMKCCVFFYVRTEFSNIFRLTPSFKGLIRNNPRADKQRKQSASKTRSAGSAYKCERWGLAVGVTAGQHFRRVNNIFLKVKSSPTTRRRRGERRYSAYSLTTLALDGVSGQRHAPAALYPQ